MHGHKRSEYKARLKDETVSKKLAEKAQQWYVLNQQVFRTEQECHLRLPQEDSTTIPNKRETILLLTDKLLRVNPDAYTLWNIRRRSLLYLFEHATNTTDDGDSRSWKHRIVPEFQLTAASLERNPKAYGAWFHRKWSLRRYMLHGNDDDMDKSSIVKKEVTLTEQFLKLDERNFHCWNYRRYIIGILIDSIPNTMNHRWDGSWSQDTATNTTTTIMGSQVTTTQKDTTANTATTIEQQQQQQQSLLKILQNEWDFTHDKIQQNFSNFSAFHYRSKLLQLFLLLKHEQASSPPEDSQEGLFLSLSSSSSTTSIESIAEKEWELIENIIFTEPDDQTIWWYHRFVLDWVFTNANKEQYEWYYQWLEPQATSLRELLTEEREQGEEEGATKEEATGSKSCKWVLLGLQLVLKRMKDISVATNNNTVEQDEGEIVTLLNELISTDSDRSQRYQYMKRMEDV